MENNLNISDKIEADINKNGIEYILQNLTSDKKTYPMIAKKCKWYEN